jgi:DNA-binding MarR family transcriptional regulator
MRSRKTLNPIQPDEERSWRAERRASEERRALVEQYWREHPGTIRGVRAMDRCKADWLAAMRWRRRIQSVCRGPGLTFSQWLLLDSIRQLTAETGDAVIQAQIAARLELDQATVSELTQRLEAKGLLSRGVDITGKAWRVVLTETAERMLRQLDVSIESASAAARRGSD